MKTCPDCAEMVQDAARKCRFCNFEFVPAALAAPAAPAALVAPAAPTALIAPPATTPRSSAPFLILSVAGTCLAIGGLALCFLYSTGEGAPTITVGALVLGGVLLAIGWSALVPRGVPGIVPALGGLALAGCVIVAALLEGGGGDAERTAKGLLLTGGLLVCALTHLQALEALDFDGTRLAALMASVAFGVELLAISRKFGFPQWLQAGLMWTGTIGTVLFGAALAVSAASRSKAGE